MVSRQSPGVRAIPVSRLVHKAVSPKSQVDVGSGLQGLDKQVTLCAGNLVLKCC